MSDPVAGPGIFWRGMDPRRYAVQIKSGTWFYKITNADDRQYLRGYAGIVQAALENPFEIREDPGHPGHEHYIDIAFFPEAATHPLALVVAVEVLEDGTRDVASIMGKTSFKQETGGVLYARPGRGTAP